MKKAIAMILTAAMCITAFTACGSEEAGKGGTSEEGSLAESQGTTAEAGTEGGENSLAGTNENGVLVVGTNAEFPPFEYVGDDGEPDGFDIALIRAIAEKMGMEVKVENMEFDSLVTAIGSKIDVAIAGMTVDEERSQAVDFSDSYYEAVQYVIVSADSDIAKASEEKRAAISDLENQKIGVQLGTTGDFKSEEIAGATVQKYNKGVDAVNDLINGKVDMVIIDRNPAKVFVDKFEGKLVAIDGAEYNFETEHYAIAMAKGSDLTAKVNEALAELKEDGTFDKLVAEYIEGTEE